MPHVENWPPHLAKTYRFALSTLYAIITLAGAIGLTWPPDDALPYPYLYLLRAGGVFILVPAAVSLVAQLLERWRVELIFIWWINAGATLYITVLLLDAGPEREWMLFALFILAAMVSLLLRGLTLLTFERRTRVAKEGRKGWWTR